MEEIKNYESKPVIYHYLDIIGKTNLAGPKLSPEYVEYKRKWEENPKQFIVSDFPLYLNVEVSGKCNLMCGYCFRHSRRTNSGDMDMSLFQRIIDEGAEYNLPAANLSFLGESFLHPQLFEMLKYLKNKGIVEAILDTNGTLLDDEKIVKIFESGLDKIIFSIDIATEQAYNTIKFGSDFTLVNKNIERFLKFREEKGSDKPNVTVQMMDYEHKLMELMAFIFHWKGKADRIRIVTRKYPDGRPNDRNRKKNTSKTIFPCPQLWQRLVVAWDGTIYPCIGDNACREPIGNVKEDRIYDIWHGDRMNYLRDMHSKYRSDDVELCLHCELNKLSNIADMYGIEQKK